MTSYGPIVQELEQAQATIVKLQHLLNLRQVRVTHKPPGGPDADVTTDYADGLRLASDAILKATAVLKGLKG